MELRCILLKDRLAKESGFALNISIYPRPKEHWGISLLQLISASEEDDEKRGEGRDISAEEKRG